jgi:hypothetical protein
MPRVHTTKEYEKSRENLLTRGKIGKDVYDKARVAEAEALQGFIQTVPRTHHGEARIPDAEKYDLPGDFRLVVQRINGLDAGRVFLFVGSHEDAEKWLERNRGLRWQQKAGAKAPPDVVSRLERDKQKLQDDLRSRETEQRQLIDQLDSLVLSNDELEGKLLTREKELERLSAQVRELESRQGQIEAERQQAQRQGEQLTEQHRQLVSERANLNAEQKRQAAERLSAQVRELESRQGQIEAERQQAQRQREQFTEQHRQLVSERANLQLALQCSNSERARLSSRVSQLERENRRLRQQTESRRGHVLPQPRRPWIWVVLTIAAVVLCLLVALIINGLADSRDDKPQSGQSIADKQALKQPEQGQSAARSPALSPDQATARVGQVCTVEFVVRSARASKDAKLVFLNSERNYQNPNNFTVMLAGEVLSLSTESAAAIAQSWIGKTIRVRGKVEPYKGRYEIKVESRDQLDPP